MLKHEDNERLVRVGRGTPAGELFRRYWMPACLSEELPEKAGAPLRVRLLGEDLVAFRDENGDIGLVDAHCPHRRAPMFFGRNEDCGLRCVFHGWKFDRHGNCVDMPSEPIGTPLKDKVKITAYPVFEAGGVVWTYMGPREKMPPRPDYEWMRAPSSHGYVSKTLEECNYLQGLEGGLDTAHSSFAHNIDISEKRAFRNMDTAPRLDVNVTDYGYNYVSTRDAGDNEKYIRVYQYIMPAQQARGAAVKWAKGGGDNDPHKIPKLDGHIWAPIDDENTWVYNWSCAVDRDTRYTKKDFDDFEHFAGRGDANLIPGTYMGLRNKSNDYLIDRKLQKHKTYTGITGVNTQDFALQEGMGPISDRTKEFLGTSDKAIITMRRLMLEATRQVESGETPRGIDPAAYRDSRPYDAVIPADVDWQEAFRPLLAAKW